MRQRKGGRVTGRDRETGRERNSEPEGRKAGRQGDKKMVRQGSRKLKKKGRRKTGERILWSLKFK